MPIIPRMLRATSATVLVIAAASSLRTAEAQLSMRTSRVASGLALPLYATAPAGDFNRLFIVEQRSGSTGRIRILDLTQNPPALLATPYLSIGPVSTSDEQGLLGLAFHPDFASNGYFYVDYTNSVGTTIVARYQANAPYMSSTTAVATSAQTVLTQFQPQANHNGGWMGFGPDHLLYVDFGDGGNANDTGTGHNAAIGNAQDMTTWLGKQLRIDIDGDDFPADPNKNYAVPGGNPFASSPPALPEIWHYGLRNPWRASFDRSTGDMWIADVGQNAIEEVDFIAPGVSGLNFGWRCTEGNSCTGIAGCVCNGPTLTAPIHTYAHTSGNCSITGGYCYRGGALCNFQGTYFFADYCAARIWTLQWNGSVLQNLTERTAELAPGGGLAINSITSFGEDAAGELYICDRGGEVFKIVPGLITDCNQNGVHDACDLASGASQDWNGNGVLDECEPTPASAGCFGDGSTPTACPCNNTGAPGRGCENSALAGGARLDAVGNPSLDQVVLISTRELPTALTVFLQFQAINASGVTFGDGVRCGTGPMKRLYTKNASAGTAHAPALGEASITARSTARGDPLSPNSGQVRYYQAYYRDPNSGFCPTPQGDTWNISSMLTIIW